jgi:hypothetical protein
MQRRRAVKLCGAIFLMSSFMMAAQTPTVATAVPPQIKIVGPTNFKGVPYSLMLDISTFRTLDDGTTTTDVHAERRMSDGSGRVRTEFGQMKDGEFKVKTVEIKDYSAWTITILNLQDSTARVVRLDAPFSGGLHPVPLTAEQAAASREKEVATRERRANHPDRVTTEKLPPQTIADLPIDGTRTTRVIAAGVEGNDHEIAVVTESWINPEFKAVMLRKLDDPRTGRTIEKVVEVKRGNLDPALFHLPPGFKIVDPAKDGNR